MLHWTWWLLTLALQGKLHRALEPKLYATRNLCMYDFLKLHHNWDTYMGVQKERKSTFLIAFEQREKQARSLFAAQYWHRSCLWMSLSSESSVSNIIPRYLYWSTYFKYWPPNCNNGVAVLYRTLSLKRHTNSFLAVENNPLRFCIRLNMFDFFSILENLNSFFKHLKASSWI